MADWYSHQTRAGFWQDAVTNTATGGAANAGSHAFARAIDARNQLNAATLSPRSELLCSLIKDPVITSTMSLIAYTSGVILEADLQNLHHGE